MKFLRVIWFVFFCNIILQIVSAIIRNKKSPIITVSATVVEKRVTTAKTKNGYIHSYFVHFQTSEGTSLEMQLFHDEYDNLAIGDKGLLTHQGTWYKGFSR